MKDTGSSYTSNLRVQNSSSNSKKLWVEPWGDTVLIPPGVTLEIVAKGPTGDCLEVESGDADIAIYGWTGSTLAIFQSGERIREYLIPPPPTPPRARLG
jgi:hypothetical protein